MLGVRDGLDGSVKSRRRSRDPKRRDERIFQQEVVYLRALLRGFGYPQRGATEIWEDNASCIMMSETPSNRDRSRHVDVKVHFLRDLVRDGCHIKLVKCCNVLVHRMCLILLPKVYLDQLLRNMGNIWLVLRYLSRFSMLVR
jgi:hypothetical protein